MKDRIFQLASFLGGLYFVLYFLIPEKTLTGYGVDRAHQYVTDGFILIGTVAFAVGIINIVIVHGRKLVYLNRGWSYSAALLIGLISMLTLSAIDWSADLRAAKKIQQIDVVGLYMKELQKRGTVNEADGATIAQTLGVLKEQYAKQLTAQKETSLSYHLFDLLNQGFFIALGSAMFALLGVYIATAAYRAFKIRTFESACMLAAACIVMLGQIPFGLWISSDLPFIRLWLLEVPNSAAFRAIRIGSAIAAFILAIRIWLPLDKRWKV